GRGDRCGVRKWVRRARPGGTGHVRRSTSPGCARRIGPRRHRRCGYCRRCADAECRPRAAGDRSGRLMTHRERNGIMTRQLRLFLVAFSVAATTLLIGCTAIQDTFQVGQREFTYDTAAEAEESPESFRFQGFLPDDGTDIRLIAQLDGHAAVM